MPTASKPEASTTSVNRHHFPAKAGKFFLGSPPWGRLSCLPPRELTACSDEWYFVGYGTERSDLGSPFGRAGCPARGSLRGSHVTITRFQTSNVVPSQSACSADSSPKGRAKGAIGASAIAFSTAAMQKACPHLRAGRFLGGLFTVRLWPAARGSWLPSPGS